MAPKNKADIAEQNHELVDALLKLSKKSPKLVRSSTYPAPADPTVTIRSWKMNEFKYYDIPSPFPTLARGLFTHWVSQGSDSEDSEKGKHRIVARGYDKFFNIGEVPWTNWKALETHTTAPYVLTLKSNGCIIFIAALTDSKLVITSKHSLGPIKGQATSHALEGEAWLRKHLKQAGKTEEQLAKTLWDNGWTAVAELCDDNFEEHVLPISEEMTGLHLHGINHTTGAFQTRNPAEVEAFAREWGFIPTAYISLDTVTEVREFTQEVSKSGKWKGQAIEGFVVRTQISTNESAPAKADDVLNVTGEKNDDRSSRSPSDRDAPPYPAGSSFFFKVKFDEPYMMYRDWREITKTLLSTKSGNTPKISKAKLNRPETRLYKTWVEKEIQENRKAFDGYTNNKGIIATRERFLKWCEDEGKGKLAEQLAQKPGMVDKEQARRGSKGDAGSESQQDGEQTPDNRPQRSVIVPIAIPGCGKTTIAVALSHLFGFGHTQSDDVKSKKPAPAFLQHVVNLLYKHDVVIADKNNHMAQHRLALRTATANMIPRPRLIALNWSLEQPPAIVHRICSDRIQARGENHQSLRPDHHKVHEDVVWMFMDQSEGLGENEVDEIIEMDIEEDLHDSVVRAIDSLVRLLGLERPSDERIGEALRVATTYSPSGKKQERQRKELEAMQGKEAPAKKHSPGKSPRYYGLLPELDLDSILDARFAESDVPEDAKLLWADLKKRHRVAKRPHVTLVHSKSRTAEKETWDRCESVYRLPSPPSFSFKLGHIIYDDRVMAITVEDLKVSGKEDGSDLTAGAEFLENLPEATQKRLHITVGTRDQSINPVEAKSLVESWRSGAKVSLFDLKDTQAQGRIKGLYN